MSWWKLGGRVYMYMYMSGRELISPVHTQPCNPIQPIQRSNLFAIRDANATCPIQTLDYSSATAFPSGWDLIRKSTSSHPADKNFSFSLIIPEKCSGFKQKSADSFKVGKFHCLPVSNTLRHQQGCYVIHNLNPLTKTYCTWGPYTVATEIGQ